MLTLRQAAELTGKSKSTLSRAIKRGQLSASRDGNGVYAIDPAELARAYPFKSPRNAEPDATHGAPCNSRTDEDDATVLRLKLVLLAEERERERTAVEREREQLVATVADLRMRLDQAEQRVAAFIGYQNLREKRSWWPWTKK